MFRTANGSVREEISGSNFTQGRGNYNLTFNPQIYVIPCPNIFKNNRITYEINSQNFAKSETNLANWREKSFEQSSQSTRSFLKGSSPLYIYIYTRSYRRETTNRAEPRSKKLFCEQLPQSSLLFPSGCA